MTIRNIKAEDIREKVKKLCFKANTVLRPDVLKALKKAMSREKDAVSREMLSVLIENARIAEKEHLAICQDTGMVEVFLDIGENVHVCGDLKKAVNNGIKECYSRGHFRKSVVKDPVLRDNSGTNTPAVIHIDIVKGDSIYIEVMPKGFGCENKSKLKMFNPTATLDEITDFCIDTACAAGPDACPPYVLGIGIGGTMEECALLSKKALLVNINKRHRKDHFFKMEERIKKRINGSGIGVMGLGGKNSVLGVNIKEGPTHIAGLPVAVSISCHAMRSAKGKI